MTQPKWKTVAHIGDVSVVEHGGGYVQVDELGKYPPELWLWFPPCEDDKNSYGSIVTVIFERDPESEWFWTEDSLQSVADYADWELWDLKGALKGDDLRQKAHAYQDLVSYYGADNFGGADELTYGEASKLFAKLAKQLSKLSPG